MAPPGSSKAHALEALKAYNAAHAKPRGDTETEKYLAEKAEEEVQNHLARIWQEREKREIEREPSLAQIPRILLRKKPGGSAKPSELQQELGKQAGMRLRKQMNDMVLVHAQLEKLWGLLKTNSSPPHKPGAHAHRHAPRPRRGVRRGCQLSWSRRFSLTRRPAHMHVAAADGWINWDDFTQIAEEMHDTAGHATELTDAQIECFFGARHFVLFDLDKYGRIPIVHYFQWAMRKNELMRTRAELSMYDSTGGDGYLTENDLQAWVNDLLLGGRLPALTGLLDAFVHFYVVTAVRKFFFFLDPRRRGRIAIKDLLLSPILQELLDLRRPDLAPEDLRANWFSQQSAAQIYDDYLQLDVDQNGMLSASELGRWRDNGLTSAFVQRLWQETNLYARKDGKGAGTYLEMDYKLYLDFVLANMYKTTEEALRYHFRILDFNKTGRLTVFEINYFFRGVVERMMEMRYGSAANGGGGGDSSRRDSDAEKEQLRERERESAKLLEDVVDEVFDMVKPEDPNCITLKDLIECKVGETVVGILTDVYGFLMYDQREQLMHEKDDD